VLQNATDPWDAEATRALAGFSPTGSSYIADCSMTIAFPAAAATLSAEPTDRQLEGQLTPDARAMSVSLRNDARLSTGEIAELLGRSRPHTSTPLRTLEGAGIVRGSARAPRTRAPTGN
jgi:predicted transcriptional regulator